MANKTLSITMSDEMPPLPPLLKRCRTMIKICDEHNTYAHGNEEVPIPNVYVLTCWKCALPRGNHCDFCFRNRNQNGSLFISQEIAYLLISIVKRLGRNRNISSLIFSLFMEDRCLFAHLRGGMRCMKAMPPVEVIQPKRLSFSL